jgi:hypothetical protein
MPTSKQTKDIVQLHQTRVILRISQGIMNNMMNLKKRSNRKNDLLVEHVAAPKVICSSVVFALLWNKDVLAPIDDATES